MTPADAARQVIADCRSLALYTEESGHITRTFLSAPMRMVHDELAMAMTVAGMNVSVDAAGNLRAIRRGSGLAPSRLFIGSHLDSVPHAGAFDGVLGVVMGVALGRLLGGRDLPFDIEVIGFSEEEGVRFGTPFIGSRALIGTIDDALLSRVDAHGISVRDAIVRFGLDPAAIPQARFSPQPLGYLEFHIEQGPVLERQRLPVGVVRSIVGQSRAEVTFIGTAAHAGTTPMPMRRDALAGAAEWVGVVEKTASTMADLVATVGSISPSPGAANVIAGTCRMTVDVRHSDDATRHGVVARLEAAAEEIAARRGLSVDWRTYLDQPAIDMDASMVTLLERAVASTGTRAFVMSSGAGHDAMVLAPHMPTAMLFVRSPGGISHHPDERVLEEDVAVALAAGMHFIEQLVDGIHD